MSGAPAWTVAVLGFGEAGADIAAGLASAGARVRGYDPVASPPPGVEATASDADACAGADLVLSLTAAAEAEVPILPVDGEHSAIFQCLLADKRRENIHRLILTASGGPFHSYSTDELFSVSPEQALRHPNWSMGRRITIDSATLMNKGFEVIEARWLFGMDVSKIDVVIHPESIVHSMVEFIDGSILAHLSTADMRLQIQLALTYPERRISPVEYFDLVQAGHLTFCEADTGKFPCLGYAYEAGETGGTMPAVVNGADEVAVSAFLERKIDFLKIPNIIKQAMEAHEPVMDPSLEDIMAADMWAREFAEKTITQHSE